MVPGWDPSIVSLVKFSAFICISMILPVIPAFNCDDSPFLERYQFICVFDTRLGLSYFPLARLLLIGPVHGSSALELDTEIKVGFCPTPQCPLGGE